jgi:hypothetical protein
MHQKIEPLAPRIQDHRRGATLTIMRVSCMIQSRRPLARYANGHHLLIDCQHSIGPLIPAPLQCDSLTALRPDTHSCKTHQNQDRRCTELAATTYTILYGHSVASDPHHNGKNRAHAGGFTAGKTE